MATEIVKLTMFMEVEEGMSSKMKRLEHHVDELLDLDSWPEIKSVSGVKIESKGTEGLNTRIWYLYRDACNYKVQNSCVIKGVISDADKTAIMESLEDGEYFIPESVGLPAERFDSVTEDDHPYMEMGGDGCFEVVSGPAEVDFDGHELAERFQRMKGCWEKEACCAEI